MTTIKGSLRAKVHVPPATIAVDIPIAAVADAGGVLETDEAPAFLVFVGVTPCALYPGLVVVVVGGWLE